MFGSCRVDDMGGSKRCILMLVFSIIAPVLLTSSVTASSPHDDLHGFTLSQEHGEVFDDLLYLNGSSTVSLTDFNWVLLSLDRGAPPLESGKLTSVTAVAESIWDWEIEVNVSAYDCTCLIHIVDSSTKHPPIISRIVYLGQHHHIPHILPFSSTMNGFLNEKPLFHLSQSNLALEIPVVMPQIVNQESFVKLRICPAPNGFCLTEMVDFFNFNTSVSDEQILLELDRTGVDLLDGFWLFNITLSDALLRSSNTEHFMVLMDQNLPETTLSCDASVAVNEGVSSDSQPQSLIVGEGTSISFSASVDDGYVGGRNILTWTLVLPDESRRALLPSEQISESLITLNPQIPGIWSVELLVRDTAGWLSHSSVEFNVDNIAPVAIVELDSFVVGNGATVSLTAGENWTLNSSKSSDTLNDEADLIHTWYVNGNTFVTGKTTLLASDFTKPGLYDVVLIVADDNGETSELTFQVQINDDVDSSEVSSKTLFVSGTLFIFVLLTIGLLVSSARKKSRQTVVPKWVSSGDLSDDKAS